MDPITLGFLIISGISLVMSAVSMANAEDQYQEMKKENARLEAKADAQYNASIRANFVSDDAFMKEMLAKSVDEFNGYLTGEVVTRNMTNYTTSKNLYNVHSFGPTIRDYGGSYKAKTVAPSITVNKILSPGMKADKQPIDQR